MAIYIEDKMVHPGKTALNNTRMAPSPEQACIKEVLESLLTVL